MLHHANIIYSWFNREKKKRMKINTRKNIPKTFVNSAIKIMCAVWMNSRQINQLFLSLKSQFYSIDLYVYICNGCPEKNVPRVNGYKTVSTSAIQLKFTEHNVKVLNDTHTKNQVNRINLSMILRLMKRRLGFGGFGGNSAQLFDAERIILFLRLCARI